jgi:hypothetical protein
VKGKNKIEKDKERYEDRKERNRKQEINREREV